MPKIKTYEKVRHNRRSLHMHGFNRLQAMYICHRGVSLHKRYFDKRNLLEDLKVLILSVPNWDRRETACYTIAFPNGTRLSVRAFLRMMLEV